MNPLITIYITCHNYEKFVSKSIESALNQTYSNIEIIIIDDGSVDSSKQIIHEYKNHPNIRIFSQKNIGLNRTNNKAIKLSNGSFIMRLDADDYLHPAAIEKLLAKFKTDSAIAAVFPDYFNVDIHGNIINRVKRHNFSKEVTLYDLPAHGACTMIRKKCIEELGGYDEEFDRQDGYDIWLKIISRFKVSNLNEPLFFYRQHGFNLTNDYQKLLRTRASIKSKFWKKHLQKQPMSQKNLIIVPTRGFFYSKKSIHLKQLKGRPLLSWSIDEALKVSGKNQIVLSTPCTETINKLKNVYADELLFHYRDPQFSNLNSSINNSIEDIVLNFVTSEFDNIAILYPEYPFRRHWQISECFQTLDIFGADSVDGVIADKSFLYSHKGKGLEPITKEAYIKHEREEVYKRVGGINAVKYKYFKSNKMLLGGKIAHINFDKVTGFRLEDEVDLHIAKQLFDKLIQD